MIPITPGSAPGNYRLTVTKPLCVGPPDTMFMFGGMGLASALAAVEAHTSRATVWAAAQYLSYARPGTELDLEVIVPVAGKRNSQARVITRPRDHHGERRAWQPAGQPGAAVGAAAGRTAAAGLPADDHPLDT